MARSDLVNHPMVTGAGPQKNHWYNYPDYQMETAQRAVNRADSAMLDGARNWPWSPRRKSLWWRFRRWLMGPWKPRYVIGADPAEAFGELALLNAKRGARRLADQIWTGVCDSRAPQPSPRRPRRDIPAWALFCYPTVAGLVVGALLYLLRP